MAQQNNSSRVNVIIRPFLLLILLGALALSFRLLQPFINPIILATVLAGLFHPLQRRIFKRFPRGSRSLISLAMVALITLVIILPVFVFVMALVDQGIQLSATVREWAAAGKFASLQQHPYVDQTLEWIAEKLPFVKLDDLDLQAQALALAKILSEFFLRHGAGMLGNLALLLTNFFIMMFIVFYFLRDGETMIKRIKHLSPLREEQENRIFAKVSGVSRSVLMGSLLTAVLQGIVGGVGMAIVGIPALFWGTMLAFASLVPVVGTALVWIPATGYLLLIGHWKSAIFFALWSAVVVGSIDNFLRPYLMRGSAGMSPFWIFLAILGGVQLFGLAGLLYGPLIIGFAMVMLMIYEEEFQQYLQEKDLGQADASRAPVRRGARPFPRVSPRRPRPKNKTD